MSDIGAFAQDLLEASLEDPMPGYRFIVSLDPTDAYLPFLQSSVITLIAAGQFSDVTGLGAELEVLAHPEGGRNDYVHQLPVRHSYSKITLSRGVVRDPGLYFWYQAGLTQSIGARRDGAIILLTSQGVPAVGWIFRGGLACRVDRTRTARRPQRGRRRVDPDRPRGAAAGPPDPAEDVRMITIQHLEVLFEAAEARDAEVFERLFARHIARYEQARTRAGAQQAQRDRERSITTGGRW